MDGPVEILLVGDNPGDVRLVREALRGATPPHRLSVVPDGVAAVAFLRREGAHATAPRADLVLLDLNLPRLDGRAVLRALKADPTMWRIPVVVLSNSSDAADVAAAYDLGASAFVTKPLDLDDFLAAVGGIAAFWGGVATLSGR